MGEETILCTNPETGPIRRMGWGIDGGVMCTAGPLNVPMPMGAVFSQWASLWVWPRESQRQSVSVATVHAHFGVGTQCGQRVFICVYSNCSD